MGWDTRSSLSSFENCRKDLTNRALSSCCSAYYQKEDGEGNLISVQNTCSGRKYQVAKEIFNLMETGITILTVKAEAG